MDLAAYLGSVGAVATVAVAGMLAVVRTFGSRLDDVTSGFNSRFDDVDRRFDELTNGINRRLDMAPGTALEPGRDG